MFGIKADFREMSGFKSKITKLVLEEKSKPAQLVVDDALEEVFEKDEEIDLDQMSAEQAFEMLQKASARSMLNKWEEKEIFDLRVN